MTKILIADDHNLVRQALSQMLQTELDMTVVGEAANAEEAVARSKLLEPDVVLMDIHMPRGTEGIEATKRITEHSPSIKVIMLTMERQDEYLFESIKAGAKGYLLKNADSEELLQAIRAVAAGEATLPPTIARKVLEEFHRLSERESQDKPYEHLTERERDILNLVGQGATNREIAQSLDIAEKTVRNRLSVIFDKLHINNRTQAALFAVREGLSPKASGSEN
ncbi:response regulator transcription factor [Candidatus Acetothermia bacterium]|nr:response regulator transcription factor [Candidatus Acetothermia bacterium]MBI3459607.1 response regulator transcription factor [Candidatus Acetothermia bacterium]MBI3658931.1 response regulator transcription factor [Candidatus Acetothermia bacterium]